MTSWQITMADPARPGSGSATGWCSSEAGSASRSFSGSGSFSGSFSGSPAGPDADFFANGGSSLGAARLVSALRRTHPGVSVADVYQHRTLRALAARLDHHGARVTAAREVAPVPAQTGVDQTMLMPVLMSVVGLRWLVALAAINNLLGVPWAPTVSWWWVLAGWLQ